MTPHPMNLDLERWYQPYGDEMLYPSFDPTFRYESSRLEIELIFKHNIAFRKDRLLPLR